MNNGLLNFEEKKVTKEKIDRFTIMKWKTFRIMKKSKLSLKKSTQQIGGDICLYYETGFNEHLYYVKLIQI